MPPKKENKTAIKKSNQDISDDDLIGNDRDVSPPRKSLNQIGGGFGNNDSAMNHGRHNHAVHDSATCNYKGRLLE